MKCAQNVILCVIQSLSSRYSRSRFPEEMGNSHIALPFSGKPTAKNRRWVSKKFLSTQEQHQHIRLIEKDDMTHLKQ